MHKRPRHEVSAACYGSSILKMLVSRAFVCVCVCVEKPTHLHFVPVYMLSAAAVFYLSSLSKGNS